MNNEREPGDFQRAVDRLERAVQEFVGTANAKISSRATRLMDVAAERLERESRSRNRRPSSYREAGRETRANETQGTEDSGSQRADREYLSRRERRRRRRHHRRSRFNESGEPGYRTSRLYRDTRRRMIAGVCAGLARYWGMERWVVRCLAITGVIFMGSIVIPAYLIAMFVIPRMPYGDDPQESTSPPSTDHRSPAPELGARLSPRTSLSAAQAALDQVELKLRRMESYVTSGQYELQRELKKIDS